MRLHKAYKQLPLICAILFEGCATICSRTMYNISVDCNEPDTQVAVFRDNKQIETLTTPSCVVVSARGGFFWPETYRFEFFKDGFSMDIQEITASLDPWWYGNIPFFVIIPIGLIDALIIDPLTGDMWKFDEDGVVQGNVERIGAKLTDQTNRQGESRLERRTR